MAIGIDPTVDFAFKKVLGSPEHPAVTLHFLNAVLSDGPKITKVEILDPILGKDHENDKLAILDVRATDEHGRRLNIEMQTTLPAGLPERLSYYATSQYVGQMQEGDRYTDLRTTIGICVLDAVQFPKVSELHHDFRLRSSGGDLTLTDQLQIHLLELPKYAIPSDNGTITDPIEQWLFFFRRVKELTLRELSSRLVDPAFTEAAGVLQMIARSPRERELYEARLKAERDQEARIQAAEVRAKAEGELIGQIRMLERFLGLPATDKATLSAMDNETLSKLAVDLERQYENFG